MNFDIDDWKILALGRKTERTKIVDELKRRFTGNDWYCTETRYGMTVFYTPTGQEAKVSFDKVEYPSGNSANVETYYLVFNAPFLDFRPKAEKAHKDFFWEIYHKIRWKKQGIWFLDGKKIPISKKRTFQKQ